MPASIHLPRGRMTDLAYLFLRDDAFLGFRAGEVVRVNMRTVTMWSTDRIAFANYGYLAGLLGHEAIQPLSEPDVIRLAGQPLPLHHLQRIA